jgi:hypothetical protein
VKRSEKILKGRKRPWRNIPRRSEEILKGQKRAWRRERRDIPRRSLRSILSSRLLS